MTHIVAGNAAPDFSLKGLNARDYSLHPLLEKGPVVAAFFKSSCPVCQFTFPFLERLYKTYGGPGNTILAISQDHARDTAGFVAEFGLTLPVALDGKTYPASNAYGLTNVPTIFLIDTDSTVKVVCNGFDKKGLEDIAAFFADRQKIAAAPLFRPNEKVPDHKPG